MPFSACRWRNGRRPAPLLQGVAKEAGLAVAGVVLDTFLGQSRPDWVFTPSEKLLGIFCHVSLSDHKPHYLADASRVVTYLREAAPAIHAWAHWSGCSIAWYFAIVQKP